MDQTGAWDAFYRGNGRAWRGNCRMPDPLDGTGRALDIGCGSGKSASTLIDMGYEVSGTDVSSEAIGICRERFGPEGFSEGSVLSLPFPDSSFDYVVAVHVLEHIPDSDMPAAVAEILRVTRPGGYLFIRDFAPGDLREDSRADSDILYVHRAADEMLSFFDGFLVVSCETVEERTRFGAVRRRAELLLRKRYERVGQSADMKCPRCGTDNPPETLFCENCDWRMDMKFRPDRVSNMKMYTYVALILGAASVVLAATGNSMTGAIVGAIVMVMGGYTVSLCRLTDPGAKASFYIAALALMLGVIGFLVGFSGAAGAF